jgi:outer membrane protein assembly factor BamA
LQVKNANSFKKELTDISMLQPNKKVLGIAKLRLWFYNVASQHRENKFRYWMKNKVGEPPVLMDSSLAIRSTQLIQNYLVNKGYFYANVNYEVLYKRKQATVVYQVTPGKLYSIDKVLFPTGDDSISRIIRGHASESKIKPHTPFSVSDLKAERERIADDLRDHGYFYFNKEYVAFDIDSSKNPQLLDLYVRIIKPSDSTQHEVYYINNVYIYTDYTAEQLQSHSAMDTLQVGEYIFLCDKLRYRPDIITSAIHFSRDRLYSKQDNTLTINQLADLGIFKFINVKFEPSHTPGLPGRRYLDCVITLTPAKKQEIAVDAQLNNNSNYLLGVSASLTYRHKNLFHGAELFELNVTGGLETNFDKGQSFFSTLDLSAYANLYFNKFLAPPRLNYVARNYRPKTRISAKYSFLRRIDYYTITTTNLSFGYDWNMSQTHRHILNLASISLVRVLETSQAFEDILDKSQTLRNSFSEQLIVGSNYSYIWSNKVKEKPYGYFYFRGNFEIAGNSLQGINALAHIGREATLPYKLFGVPYAQFVLMDADIRNYYTFGKHALLASRMYAGIGIPYGNSSGLPYVKQFYGGGTNDIRAWTVRTLGPGSFVFDQSSVSDNSNFYYDQTGDMKLEANVELRFDIYKFIKAALFVDAGNIWTLKSDTLRPGANFDVTRFGSEIAIGTGLGFRFDFSYFVLRFDMAFPVRNPGVLGNRWVIGDFDPFDKDWRKDNLKFNLAIGYPF